MIFIAPSNPNHSRILQALHSLLEQVKEIPDKEPWKSGSICFVIIVLQVKLGLSGEIPEVSVRLEM